MISVVVPAYNASRTIRTCLAALAHQTVPASRYEVIVVDDGSTDDTAALAQAAGARVIVQRNQGPAAARNHGAQEACGEILLFTDSDCEPAPDWIEQMLAAFEQPEIAGAKGAYRTRQTERVARFVQLEYEDKYDRMAHQARIDFIDTYSAGYRRAVFLENGGFDTTFSTASVEDQEFSFRLAQRGCAMVFNPAARVYHLHDGSLGEYARRKFGIGYWKALVMRKHPDKIVRDSHTPQTIKLQMLLLGLLGVSSAALLSWPRVAVWAVGITAAGFVFSAMPFVGKIARRDPGALPVALPALVVRAAALGAGLVAGSIHFAGLAETSGRSE